MTLAESLVLLGSTLITVSDAHFLNCFTDAETRRPPSPIPGLVGTGGGLHRLHTSAPLSPEWGSSPLKLMDLGSSVWPSLYLLPLKRWCPLSRQPGCLACPSHTPAGSPNPDCSGPQLSLLTPPQGPCLLLRGWGSVKVGGGCPPLAGSAGYLTRYPVGAELPEAQRGLDPPQQGHHVQVLDPAPAGVTRPVPQAPPPPSLPGEGPRGGSQETGTPPDFQPCVGSWEAGFPF